MPPDPTARRYGDPTGTYADKSNVYTTPATTATERASECCAKCPHVHHLGIGCWRCIVAALDAHAAAAVAKEWRPIASAPKDGTYVLVATIGTQPIVARFDFQWGWLTLPGKYAASPTHWMPLPPPPTPGP